MKLAAFRIIIFFVEVIAVASAEDSNRASPDLQNTSGATRCALTQEIPHSGACAKETAARSLN
eukprot:7312139-Pyramimonas_sp.AAC.1